MLTIKAEVQKDRKRMDGTYNVKIRFTKDRAVKRISTNLFATEEDLTADLKLKEVSVIKQEADRLVLHYRMLFTSLHLDSENYERIGLPHRLTRVKRPIPQALMLLLILSVRRNLTLKRSLLTCWNSTVII